MLIPVSFPSFIFRRPWHSGMGQAGGASLTLIQKQVPDRCEGDRYGFLLQNSHQQRNIFAASCRPQRSLFETTPPERPGDLEVSRDCRRSQRPSTEWLN